SQHLVPTVVQNELTFPLTVTRNSHEISIQNLVKSSDNLRCRSHASKNAGAKERPKPIVFRRCRLDLLELDVLALNVPGAFFDPLLRPGYCFSCTNEAQLDFRRVKSRDVLAKRPILGQTRLTVFVVEKMAELEFRFGEVCQVNRHRLPPHLL